MKQFSLLVAVMLLLAVAILPIRILAASAATDAPSFSCDGVRATVEKAICANATLSTADRNMAKLFALARGSATGHGPSNELKAQREAVEEMRSCAATTNGRSITQCLAASYNRRNFELATAILIKAPDTALPILREIDPDFAAVLEAIALWAKAPVDAPWNAPERAASRKRIIALLGPYLIAMKTQDDQSFGWSILSRPAGNAPRVKEIDDIFQSERHFIAFLNVLGPYMPDKGSAAVSLRDLPCAAIVRHPALLGATDAVFGSTMDNFRFRTDCARTLPPLPALTALDRKIVDSWPACEGTIRFAAYRSYNLAVDAARLGQTPESEITGDRPDTVPASDVESARTDMIRYYTGYFGKTAKEAQVLARVTLAAILSAAHSCGT